jgi:type II secretory pathway component PulM
MRRATNDEWNRYYQTARYRSRESGRDPLERYVRRHEARQKGLFVGSSALLVTLLAVFYSVLTR